MYMICPYSVILDKIQGPRLLCCYLFCVRVRSSLSFGSSQYLFICPSTFHTSSPKIGSEL